MANIGTVTKDMGGGFTFTGVITTGIFMLIIYLFLAGAIGWSRQLQWMAIIGAIIWILLRKR
jgi:hypothetical protein